MTKRLSTWDDYRQLQWLDDGDYNHAAHRLVFTRSAYGESDSKRTQIVARDTVSGEETVITAGGMGESGPVLSPDGRELAFISSTAEGRQIWIYNFESAEVRRLTSLTFAPADLRWAPDGAHIAFLSYIPRCEQKAYDPEAPVVIEDYGFKFDGAGYSKASVHAHLWCADVGTGEAAALTEGDSDDMLHNWSYDGRQLVFASNRARSKAENLAMDIFTVPCDGGEPERVSSGHYAIGYPVPFRPIFTQDGKSIVSGFLEIDKVIDPTTGYPPTRLYRYDLDTKEKYCLMPEGAELEVASFPYNAPAARCRDSAVISSDGKRLLFLSGRNGGNHVFSAAIYGEPEIKTVLEGRRCCIGLAAAEDGKVLLASGDAADWGSYSIIDDTTGETRQYLLGAGEFMEQVAVSVPEVLWTDTLDGESRVQGWVLPPQGYEPGRKYPAIVCIHGGPHPFYSHSMEYEHQCLAGAGFAVIYLNPRGSSGYGRKHQNMARAYDGSAYMDILQFVDEACRRCSFIDPDRIGVTGGSYGGYMTNYIATHSKRFGAYVTQRSIVNKLIDYGSSDIHYPPPKDEPFISFMLRQLNDSIIVDAQRIDKPFLIFHGENDYRCPVEGAHQLFVALKDCRPELPVKMILFPHTSHNIPGDLSQKLFYYEEMTRWFSKYL